MKKIFVFSETIGFNSNEQSNPKNSTVTGVKAGLNLSYYKKSALLYLNQGCKGKEFEVCDELTNKVKGENK